MVTLKPYMLGCHIAAEDIRQQYEVITSNGGHTNVSGCQWQRDRGGGEESAYRSHNEGIQRLLERMLHNEVTGHSSADSYKRK